jgi:hypothetical protein
MKRLFLIAGAAAVLMSAGCNRTSEPAARGGSDSAPDSRTFEQALKAQPQNLAASYLEAEYTLREIELGRAQLAGLSQNWSISTTFDGRPAVINASNADTYAGAFSERRAAYAAAIEKRGYPKIAGTYTARENEACKATGSNAVLLLAGNMGLSDEITITQDGFRVILTNRPVPGAQGNEFSHPGAVVESVIFVQDAATSDIRYLGSVSKSGIDLRPWVESIRESAPADPIFNPNWNALSQCLINLRPR